MSNSQDTYQKHLTLDEIQANDIEMTKDAIRHAKKYNFGPDAKKAALFVRSCLERTFIHLGMTSPRPPENCRSGPARLRHAAKIDQEMRNKQVRVENRNKYRGSDAWRCGIYIYQRDELVCFISDVLTQRRTEVDPLTMKVGREEIGFIVITNARLEDTKRIYLMPGLIQRPSGN